jgi:phosphate transport system substrate-binding protein
VGSGAAVERPAGVGAEGVAGNIKNSIGYVEYAYAEQSKLIYAALVNKAGKTVQPRTRDRKPALRLPQSSRRPKQQH